MNCTSQWDNSHSNRPCSQNTWAMNRWAIAWVVGKPAIFMSMSMTTNIMVAPFNGGNSVMKSNETAPQSLQYGQHLHQTRGPTGGILILLTLHTGCHVSRYIMPELRPPKCPRDQVQHLEDPEVSRCQAAMTLSQDDSTEESPRNMEAISKMKEVVF